MAAGDETSGELQVGLRPVERDDLPLLRGEAVNPVHTGPFNWFGFRNAGEVARRYDEDGFLGDEDGTFVVTVPEGTVGTVGWHAVWHGPNEGSRCWNIGVTLLEEWRGRGIGGRAQQLLADYLLDVTPAARIEASTDVDNGAEQRALEHAGFTREGVLRSAQFRDGGWHDLVVYSRVRADRR